MPLDLVQGLGTEVDLTIHALAEFETARNSVEP